MTPPRGLLAVVALLVAGTAITSTIDSPQTQRGRQESVDVLGATAVCPDLLKERGLVSSRVSVGAAPLPAGRTAAEGAIHAFQITGSRAELALPIDGPGQVAVDLGTNIKADGYAVAASGALAVGLEVEQITRGERRGPRGLGGMRCAPAAPDTWFVGGATSTDDISFLALANVEDVPATVDVTIYSRTGLVDPRVGQGITISPHSRTVVRIDTLAPDRQALAVHVASRRGRVAAALRHHRYRYPTPLGFDWVPPQPPPATKVVVPGFAQGPGQRWLIVANPSEDDTTVSVQVATKDAQFVPAGLDAVDVPAQSTRSIALGEVTETTALAAVVTSTGAPVLAGGMVEDAQEGFPTREISYTGAAGPLTGAALLTDLVIDRPTESTLYLTAPETDADVLVTPIRVLGRTAGPPAPRTLHVPAGRTLTFKLSTFFPPGTEAKLAVQVRPSADSGPVYAARYLRARGAHGPLTTLLVLRGPAELVGRPRVVHDVQAGYPAR